jgi:hypothetical protein
MEGAKEYEDGILSDDEMWKIIAFISTATSCRRTCQSAWQRMAATPSERRSVPQGYGPDERQLEPARGVAAPDGRFRQFPSAIESTTCCLVRVQRYQGQGKSIVPPHLGTIGSLSCVSREGTEVWEMELTRAALTSTCRMT